MRILLLATAFISWSALACPQLSGKWNRCLTSSGEDWGEKDISLSQKILNGTTIYTLTSTGVTSGATTVTNFVADGITHTRKETNETGDVLTSVTATCEGDSLIYEIKVETFGSELAYINTVIDKNKSLLRQDMSGHILGAPVKELLTCE